jgi:UDP-N-acetylmuramoylalanine--D-glutamate ligase
MKDFNKLRVVVIGAARQGIAISRYLVDHGACVTLNDRCTVDQLSTALDALSDLSHRNNALHWVLGGHPISLLDHTDLICVSGGVPLTLPLLREAQGRGIQLTNDSQIFMEKAPCRVVGITGSAGKTTTTSLLYRITQEISDPATAGFRRAWVGGNIGSPLIKYVDEMSPDDLAIMELSSFQLEMITHSPQVAAILNVSPNHLDRHITMDAYRSAKSRILEFQSEQDLAILGRDDPGAWSFRHDVRGKLISFGVTELPEYQTGVSLSGNTIEWRSIKEGTDKADTERDAVILSCKDIPLRGAHNLQNVMAACGIAAGLGFPFDAINRGIANFKGIPHRLEFVRTWGGADWYNDSIATAPERAIAAIHSFEEPLVLLAGGRDKNLPWDKFAELVRKRVDHLVVFGEAAAKIQQSIQLSKADRLSMDCCDSLQDAVQLASKLVEPGDIVLLSPGGTSFDEFTDFEERGRCFTRWVRELS